MNLSGPRYVHRNYLGSFGQISSQTHTESFYWVWLELIILLVEVQKSCLMFAFMRKKHKKQLALALQGYIMGDLVHMHEDQ